MFRKLKHKKMMKKTIDSILFDLQEYAVKTYDKKIMKAETMGDKEYVSALYQEKIFVLRKLRQGDLKPHELSNELNRSFVRTYNQLYYRKKFADYS